MGNHPQSGERQEETTPLTEAGEYDCIHYDVTAEKQQQRPSVPQGTPFNNPKDAWVSSTVTKTLPLE